MDGAVRFSISLPDFAWYLAWSMPSSQSTIVYPYFTLTYWTLTKKRYLGFCLVFARRIDIRIQFCKITTFWVISLNNLLNNCNRQKKKHGYFFCWLCKEWRSSILDISARFCMVFGMVNALYPEYDCLSLFDTNELNSDKKTLHRFLSSFCL